MTIPNCFKSNTLPSLAHNRLPADAAWLFPEYDFDTMGLESHESVIIKRVLERGTWEQLRWLFVTYGETNVAKWVRRHGFRFSPPSVRRFARPFGGPLTGHTPRLH